MKLILEQRYLFDGSVGAIGHHVTHADGSDPAHLDHHDTPISTAAPIHRDELPGAASKAHEPTSKTNIDTVLIVDTHVANWQNLVGGAKPGVDVVVLDPTKDGITQVTQALQGLTGVKNLEFLTNGAPGAITLGGSTLDLATLTARAGDITGWTAHLSSHADIVFWGCNVAEGSAGSAFVADMHTLTGATIGASTDATGASALGGNWTLEATTGALHKDVVPFSAAAEASFTGVLDAPQPSVTLAITDTTSSHVTANTVLLGDTLNVALSFSNAAKNAAGFGPYVELFAPTSLALSNVNTAGVTLTTLTATIVSGSYTNPLTGLAETAPTGVTSGSVYFMSLPYGSFTPNEPAVSISAQLNLAGGLTNTQLANLVGTQLDIEARGGFQYGAVATGGTPLLQTTPATSPETVALIESWMTVATQPGEGETATGPDFPVNYSVFIEPAPAIATSGIAVTNLTTSIQLPDGIIATGAPSASVTGSDAGSAKITSAPGAGGTIQTLSIDYTKISTNQAVTFTAYVPQDYQYTYGLHSVGTPILDPANGNPQTVAVNSSYTFAADIWNTRTVAGTGDTSAATFQAKSLAVQLIGTTGALPTQDVNYTLKFQVSDYFGLSGLTLDATLGNGLTFDPTIAPGLSVVMGGKTTPNTFGLPTAATTTVNNETIQSSGSAAQFSYAFNPANGLTDITFHAGNLIPGTYGAGTTGALSFSGTVLDAYPTAQDQVTGAGGFLRENDFVATTGSGTAASLFDYTGNSTYSASVGSIADSTATATDTLPQGDLTLSVVAVNDGGTWYTSGSHLTSIVAGDTVVYQLTYTLAQPGDFAGLNLTAYLPEPVFSVLAPTNPNTADYTTSATSTSAFTATNVAINQLASGSYTSSSDFSGAKINSVTASEPSNSITVNVSSTTGNQYLNLTPGAGATQHISIDFAVTASSLPFVDGLHLTAQGDSTYMPAIAPQIALQRSQTIFLAEPTLLHIEQGVVSVVNANGTDIGGSVNWTNATTGASATAPVLFDKAGTTGPTVFSGTAPSVLTPAIDNLNVTGAQAGDTVRLVDVVQNAGGYAAYDVIVKDALAQGLTTANVANLNFTRGDGTALAAIDPTTGLTLTSATAIAKFFSGTGVLLVNASESAPTLTAAGTAADIVYVTYDVKLPDTAPTAASLTGQATLVAWTNQALYQHTGSTYTLIVPGTGIDGNFADASAVGSTPATLTDTATVTTLAPTITDTITGATNASDPAAAIPTNIFSTHSATVTPGETISLSAIITIPQGDTGQLAPIDILPAGLQLITTGGTYHATYTDNAGTATDITSQVAFTGNKLTLPATDYIVTPTKSGADLPGTITITYQALVPGSGSAIDASTWTGANLSSHNTTLTDNFAAASEGISYTTTTATALKTTTTPGTASGIANTVIVTNPLVTSTITDSEPGNVHSGEIVTYTLTLTNASATATAYDLGSSITLPTGLTYVANSLIQTGGTAAKDVLTGNVGVNGTPNANQAIDGITLAPSSTSTYTFKATVNDNLPAATVLKVVATPAWESLPASVPLDGKGNVNLNAQAYNGGPGSVSNTVAVITPDLSIIGESNASTASFDPAGKTSGTAVTATDSDIVRMRAVLQIPEGQNGAVDLVVTLPSNLSFDAANAASTTAALISPNGDLNSSLITDATLQKASGTTPIDLTKLDLGFGTGTDPVIHALSGTGISVSGNTITFSFGTLTNNDNSTLPNYVVVEFNAVVADTTAGGTSLTTAMVGHSNGSATPVTNDFVTVATPVVSLQKVITGIVYNNDGTATVTYKDTETNTGNAPAYNLSLDDPGAGTGTASYTGPAATGNIASISTSGSHFDAVLTTLAPGTSQNFTYSVTIGAGQINTAVSDAASKATLTSYALNPAHETAGQETLIATSLAPPSRSTFATAGLDVVSGTVNQDLSPTQSTLTPLLGLSGQSVTVSFPTQTTGSETTTTDANGAYTVLVPDSAGSIAIKVTTAGTSAPPAIDTIDNAAQLAAKLPSGAITGTDPVTLTFNPAVNTNYTGVTFDFWRPLDTAPALAAGATTTFTTTDGTPVTAFAGAKVTDAQLDATFAKDYSGTTLTLQRYSGNTAAPDATDTFAGSGTLSLAAGNVILGGTIVGTYTQTGGTLAIKFAPTAIDNTTVNSVLGQIAYTSTAGGSAITIGAQIDDANNNPIALNGNALDLTGPHDQGPGGDLQSNVLKATVTVAPITPVLSIIGESNVTTGSTQTFDPTATTTGTAVTTTNGDIVRMRATVQLPEGTNANADIVVTLPNGLTFQNDSSVAVLLATPGGNATTSLTGTGLQHAESSTPIDITKLTLGFGSTDPVTAGLNAATVNGQTVTFALGSITNPNTAAGPNYVVVEFNAVVGSTTAATATPLQSTMHADANSAATATVSDYITVVQPNVTLAKTISGIAYNSDGTTTVTYVDTVANTGNGTAYTVGINDPGASSLGTIQYIGSTPVAGGGATTSGTPGADGNNHFAALMPSLAAGASESFTYSVTLKASDLPAAVAASDSLAVVTDYALNPLHETGASQAQTTEQLVNTTVTPTQYSASASAGLDLISGNVNQDLAPVSGTLTPLQGLPNEAILVSFTGKSTGSAVATTDSNGNYIVLAPDHADTISIKAITTLPQTPAQDNLDNNAGLSGSVPGGVLSSVATGTATLTFTPATTAATSYTGVAFDFWRPLDTAPVLANGPTAPVIDQVNTPVVPFATATVSDAQLDGTFSHDFSGTTLTIQRYVANTAAPDASDVFQAAGTATTGVFLSNGPSGSGNILLSGNVVGSYSETGGALAITFASTNVTATTVNAVLNGITYTSTLAGNPHVPGIIIGAQIDDANNDPIALNGNATDPAGPHDQGPGGDLRSNVLTATINVHGTGPSSVFTEPNDANPAAVAVTVDPTIDLTNLVHTNANPSQATLTIANARPEDVLTFTSTADITGTYSNGTLTLTAVTGHTPTLSEWQTAIRGVQYYDSSDVPNTANRTINVTLTAGANTATEQATVAIVPVNDSPILDSTVAVALNHATEYQGTGTPTPQGAVGTLISQIAGLPTNVTDPDANGLVNGAAPTAPGIAITGFNTADPGGRSVGSWYYSIDNGATWTAFPSTISAIHPLDLASTARIAFQPTATDFNGQIPNAITFKAWDRFDGTANGTQADLTGVTSLGQSAANNTAASAYSIASDTLPLTVDNVNNAPHASGDPTIAPVSTSDQHPTGQTVAQLFGSGFVDPQDGQQIAGANPMGSTPNGFAGIAITANAATPGQGVWEYSLDNGHSWTAIPTNVSQSNAVILPADARLAFQPSGGFSGHPGQLTVNLIDSSNSLVAPGVTGAQLAAEGSPGFPLLSFTSVNIPLTGGSTAFSATTVPLGTLVNPLPPDLLSAPFTPSVGPRTTDFPSDLRYQPSDLGFWTTDDYLARPLIPDLSLVGSVANRFIIVEQHAVISVPPNIFQDSLPDAQLTYEAKRPDGSSLPSWITFNPNDLTFSGTPPAGAYGRLEILIRARDVAGNTADATFNILIGRQQEDLVKLLQPGHRHKLFPSLHAANPADSLRQATAAWVAADQKPAATPQERLSQTAIDRVSAQAALLSQLPAPGSQAGGFSSALHAAGPMSALGRARSWLDKLDDMVRQRPAA